VPRSGGLCKENNDDYRFLPRELKHIHLDRQSLDEVLASDS